MQRHSKICAAAHSHGGPKVRTLQRFSIGRRVFTGQLTAADAPAAAAEAADAPPEAAEEAAAPAADAAEAEEPPSLAAAAAAPERAADGQIPSVTVAACFSMHRIAWSQ